MLLCTGGCRSGKSEYARHWAEARGASRVYIATAYVSSDPEMQQRIALHQQSRKDGWRTLEAASSLWVKPRQLVREAADMGDVLLFDCLTLWTSLCVEHGRDEAATLELTSLLLESFQECGRPVVLVTNEVGMGLVPENALARSFRDMVGFVNQKAASFADSVVFMVSGLPLVVKGDPNV